jgi:hypothetical protein
MTSRAAISLTTGLEDPGRPAREAVRPGPIQGTNVSIARVDS